MKKNILIGAHVSIAKELHLAFDRAESIGCTAMQIFTKSSKTWEGSPITKDAADQFKLRTKKTTIEIVMAHAGYLINIGSNKTSTEEQSVKSLLHEMQRCAQLSIPLLVLHPGAHLGAGEASAIDRIAKNLNTVLQQTDKSVSIILETTAGQGTNIGYTFEQLKQIRDLCDDKKRIGICIDTCHIFAAGYDISSESAYQKTMAHFDKVIGLSHLKAIHINGSKGDLGSKLDRHTPLGEGKIPLETFRLIMNDKNLITVPKILETPTDAEMSLWKKEIEELKNFVA